MKAAKRKVLALIDIDAKLERWAMLSGGSAVFLDCGDQVYAFPRKCQRDVRRVLQEKGREGMAEFLQEFSCRCVLPLECGRLIFAGIPSLPEWMVGFGGELDEQVRIGRMLETVSRVSLSLASSVDLITLLHKVMSLSEEALNAEASSLLLLDPGKKELYWEVARGNGADYFKGDVTLPLGKGIGGYTAATGKPVFVNDVARDPRWCPEYDQRSGFRTRSLACAPIRHEAEILGVIEVVNKRDGEFEQRDLYLLEVIGALAGAAISKARVHQELERALRKTEIMEQAKEKALHHLSHELKTPLAVVSTAFSKLCRWIRECGVEGMEHTMERGVRNLHRLLDLHGEIEDIVHFKPLREKERLLSIFEYAAGFVDELKESQARYAEILSMLAEKIESLYSIGEVRIEDILLDRFLEEVCEEAESSMKGRELEIVRRFDKGFVVRMDAGVLRKVAEGMLKNAVENTPDGGEIEVSCTREEQGCVVRFRDFGTGITEESQKMMFEAFYHTQHTDLYCSKRPYEFNAGGAGIDLLRARVFAERYGFFVGFQSTRCRFLPTDRDLCSGRIADCPHIREREECLHSGGSVFWVRFRDHQVIQREREAPAQ